MLEEQQHKDMGSQGSVSRNGSGSRLNMVSSCSPQKYSALNDVTSDQISSDQYAKSSDHYSSVEEKLRIPQVQNVLATRGSRTPSPFRTIFKGLAKGTQYCVELLCVPKPDLSTHIRVRFLRAKC